MKVSNSFTDEIHRPTSFKALNLIISETVEKLKATNCEVTNYTRNHGTGKQPSNFKHYKSRGRIYSNTGSNNVNNGNVRLVLWKTL